MSRGDDAKGYFMQGYNCTQSVVLAFKDIISIDEETLLKTVSPFGAGMGRLREVCGTVTGMFFVIGAVLGTSDPKDMEKKKAVYTHVQNVAELFRKENGSIICRELLGVCGSQTPTPSERTAEYYKKRPCAELCKNAAEILEKYLLDLPMPL